MTSYFDKFKQTVREPQAFGVIEDIKNATNILTKLRDLETEINDLTKWKNSDAIPTMKKSIMEINDIHANLTQSIVPTIQNNIATIKKTTEMVNDAKNKAIEASTIAQNSALETRTISENISNSIVPNIQKNIQNINSISLETTNAMTISIEASTTAQNALLKINEAISTIATTVNNAKVELKNYTDTTIIRTKGEFDKYVSDNLLPLIAKAQLKADEAINGISIAVNNAKIELKNYTDGTVSQTKFDLGAYIDTKNKEAQITLKQYTDSVLLNAEGELQNYTDGAISNIKTQLTTIMTNMTTDVENRVKTYTNGMVDDAKNTLTTFSINTTKTAENSLTTYINSMVAQAKAQIFDYTDPLIDEIRNIAEPALDKAKVALTNAQMLFNRISNASNQLSVDFEAIGIASNNLINKLSTEILTIRNGFITFGTEIKSAAEFIKGNMLYVKDEFMEAKTQISYPMSIINTYANRCRNDNIIFLPYNLFMTLYWGFLRL